MKNTFRPNQSTTKVLRIIEVLADSSVPLKVKELSAMLEMPGSTVLRFLHSLIEEGYAMQEKESNRYYLTMKIPQIGERVNSHFNLREVIHPYLVELMKNCGESTCLAIEVDRKTTYIDAVEGPQRILQTLQRIGKRAPLHSTGVGKNLLLNYSEEQIDDLIRDIKLEKLTEHTITTKEDLLQELQKVRELGFALDNEECEVGVKCVAAPIWDYRKQVVASISVSGPALRLQAEKFEFIKNQIIKTAQVISDILKAN